MVALVLLCGARAVRAQHALVLSGGGARGLTHAGAIVALEELGYSPPLIVGTSMGAIVGALYAAGYEPREIWSIIAAENWLEHFAAEPVLVGPRRSVRRPQVTFGMGGDRTYQGLLPTTGVNRRLVELLFDAGARARNDFDRLPRRFRAVTGDLATGEEFVIGAGDLPRAVRASMAVPGAFAPVRWDDRVLVDGGIANNLPVSVAIETRGRPVLAIDVLRPRPDLPERSAADIGIRSLRLLIENARPDTAARADILVLPPLRPGFSEVGFPADATSLLRTGYAAVHAQVPPVVPRQPHARRTPHLAPRLISGLRVEHADRATARLVRRMMRPTLGEYDVPELLRRTRALYATGLFHAVWPRLEFPDGEQEPALLSVEVSPVDPLTFAGAARWDDDLGAGAWLALRRRISLITPIELRVAGDFNELGERGSADVSVFSTLLPGVTWNVGGHASDVRVRDVVGDSVTALAEVRRSGAWAGAELHGPVRDWFVSLLARGDHIRGAGLGGWAVGPFLRVAAPPRPDRVVGIEPLIEAEQRFGDHEYRRGLVRIGTQTRVGRVQLGAFGSVESATRAAPLDALPSITRDLAPWLRVGALRSHRLGAAGIDVAHPLILNGYVRARGRLVGTAGDPAADRDDDWLVGGDVGAIWPTVIGPIAVGVAFGQHAHWGVNFSLGSTF